MINDLGTIPGSPPSPAHPDVVDLLLILGTLISRAEHENSGRRRPRSRAGRSPARRTPIPALCAYVTRTPAPLTEEHAA